MSVKITMLSDVSFDSSVPSKQGSFIMLEQKGTLPKITNPENVSAFFTEFKALVDKYRAIEKPAEQEKGTL